jgi:hypothetical protein
MQNIYHQIIELVKKAQKIASSVGIPNILQPGLVKEMVMADALGHKLIFTKRDADACDPNNQQIKYEYLSCFEGGGRVSLIGCSKNRHYCTSSHFSVLHEIRKSS